MNLVIRSTLPMTRSRPRLRAAVGEVDPSLPIVRTDDGGVRGFVTGSPDSWPCCGGFGGLALLLAAVGTYGI
jgi:hypothetical protein